ncbi:MAG TPA: HD domain-containing protein [Elusimicrobiota bacterium]|nr:HD domain-containing protein [Elusimicrobiota bacterium]
MRNSINIRDILKRYQALKELIIERKKEAERFFRFIEEETAWLTSPASTRFHNNVTYGLIAHSVGVAETALQVKALLAPQIPDESIVLCGLLHDLGKVGLPGKPFYIPNDNAWMVRNRNQAFVVNPELVAMDSAVRSLYLVARGGLPLSESEGQSIVAHDGAYVIQNRDYAHSETPLLLLISFADGWYAAVHEDKRPIVLPTELKLFNLGDTFNPDTSTMLSPASNHMKKSPHRGPQGSEEEQPSDDLLTPNTTRGPTTS